MLCRQGEDWVLYTCLFCRVSCVMLIVASAHLVHEFRFVELRPDKKRRLNLVSFNQQGFK